MPISSSGLLFLENSKPTRTGYNSPSKVQEFPGLLFHGNNKPLITGKRIFSPLLSSIVVRGINSTHALSAKYEISQAFISYVLHGRKKSKRVEQIILSEWGITVFEFQQITRDWLERRERGQTYTQSEITNFGDSVRARRLGIGVEELRARKVALLGENVRAELSDK